MRMSPTRILFLAAGLLLACGGATPASDGSEEPLRAREDGVICYSVCGDNYCDVNAESYSCPQDCGSNTCGDHICCNETPSLCPEDCPYAADYCYFTPMGLTGEAPERLAGKQERPRFTPSLVCVPQCGDNLCDVNSEAYSCPQDCGSNTCGDHVCCNENPSICPQDCPYPSDYCYFTPQW
jgi:hypothetical protein